MAENQHWMLKVATPVIAGGSLLTLSGLTPAGTVIALTIATPFFVIFSLVLFPAVIATALLLTGFLASGSFGVAAITALSWMCRYATGRHPSGGDQLDQARMKLASNARKMKNRPGQLTSVAASKLICAALRLISAKL
ncbi:hypothetical protein DITRI_Ditri04bG0009800 [Diplodiscus trichospermus]